MLQPLRRPGLWAWKNASNFTMCAGQNVKRTQHNKFNFFSKGRKKPKSKGEKNNIQMQIALTSMLNIVSLGSANLKNVYFKFIYINLRRTSSKNFSIFLPDDMLMFSAKHYYKICRCLYVHKMCNKNLATLLLIQFGFFLNPFPFGLLIERL